MKPDDNVGVVWVGSRVTDALERRDGDRDGGCEMSNRARRGNSQRIPTFIGHNTHTGRLFPAFTISVVAALMRRNASVSCSRYRPASGVSRASRYPSNEKAHIERLF